MNLNRPLQLEISSLTIRRRYIVMNPFFDSQQVIFSTNKMNFG